MASDVTEFFPLFKEEDVEASSAGVCCPGCCIGDAEVHGYMVGCR